MRSREKVIWCVCVLSAAVGYYLYAVYAAKKESKRLARVIYLCRSSVIGAPAGKPFSYDMDEYNWELEPRTFGRSRLTQTDGVSVGDFYRYPDLVSGLEALATTQEEIVEIKYLQELREEARTVGARMEARRRGLIEGIQQQHARRNEND